jgi:hypothetical protein
MRRLGLSIVTLAGLLALGACGTGDDGSNGGEETPTTAAPSASAPAPVPTQSQTGGGGGATAGPTGTVAWTTGPVGFRIGELPGAPGRIYLDVAA